MRYFTFKLSSVFLVLLLIENASGDFVQVTIVLRMYPANVWLVHAEIYEPIELNIYVIKCLNVIDIVCSSISTVLVVSLVSSPFMFDR